MQIALTTLDKNWVTLASIVTTVEDDTTYYIQNRGNDTLVACEGANEPTTEAGVYVFPKQTVAYKKGTQTLYLRALGTECTINVTSEA